MGIPNDQLGEAEAQVMPGMVDAMTKRRCDGCSECCTLLEVPELLKPIGHRCVHLNDKERCSIYANRPTGCRVFYCTWRIAEVLKIRVPNDMHPNVCGFVLHWDKGASPLCTAFVDPKRPKLWLKSKRRLEWFSRINNCAIVIGGGNEATHFVCPSGRWFSRADFPLYFQADGGRAIGVPAAEFRGGVPWPRSKDPYVD